MGLLVAVASCSEPTQERPRVVGWPRAEVPVAPAAGGAAEPDAGLGQRAASEPGGLPLPDACQVLVVRACGLLGEHTEECQVARGQLAVRRPEDGRPEAALACLEIVARLDAQSEVSGVHPCRRLARRRCRALGKETWACREAQRELTRPRPARTREGCLGDLLLWEAREVLSGLAPGSGR